VLGFVLGFGVAFLASTVIPRVVASTRLPASWRNCAAALRCPRRPSFPPHRRLRPRHRLHPPHLRRRRRRSLRQGPCRRDSRSRRACQAAARSRSPWRCANARRCRGLRGARAGRSATAAAAAAARAAAAGLVRHLVREDQGLVHRRQRAGEDRRAGAAVRCRAALRYAAAEGYFTLPIEARLALIAGGALLGLGFGWRERLSKPAFALSLQGGALGVLLLTVFAAFKLYGLLPAPLAFGMVVVLVAGSAMLSLLQRAMWLAVLGFLGGYLAPVLINTGSGNHVALFSYYALLNAAVFAISWKQSWRLLNLIGFFFTFGVGAMWGDAYWRPELFWSVEPFLILFFVFYIVIGLMYVTRQTTHRKPWVDGTLVFGTPLVAFPLQAAMLKDDRMALALSALLVSLLYAGLVWWLRQRRGERLLAEAYGALALGFATLAVPLAFSASTTASLWALEGAGAAWIGLRQNRTFPWLAGLALQLLAAGSYCISVGDGPGPTSTACC
jgi:hypothetical protein